MLFRLPRSQQACFARHLFLRCRRRRRLPPPAPQPLASGSILQPQQQPGARGFRTTTITMGLKTGIVGLPNVGKVSQQTLWMPAAAAGPGFGL